MKLLARLVCCAMLIFLWATAWAENTDDQSTLEVLVAAKFSGGCGIFSQMNAFQESTQMPGADAFLERFFKTEATRIGMTPDQYVEACRKTDKLYREYYNALNAKPAQ